MKILTVKQVAELIQAKESTIYVWAEQRIIPSLKINGLVRFDEGEILAWIKTCKQDERCYNYPIQARSPKKGGIR